MDGEDADTLKKRARTEIRLDSGWTSRAEHHLAAHARLSGDGLAQYAVWTPSKEYKEGYYHAVVFTSRTDLTMTGVVEHYGGRAGTEADRKRDKHGLGLAVIRKHHLPAQKMVVLLVALAHNILMWARS